MFIMYYYKQIIKEILTCLMLYLSNAKLLNWFAILINTFNFECFKNMNNQLCNRKKVLMFHEVNSRR